MVASDEILKRTSDQYRRIRNTFRFILGNLSDFNDKNKVEFKEVGNDSKMISLEEALNFIKSKKIN